MVMSQIKLLKDENMSEKRNDAKVICDGKAEQVSGGYEEPAVQYNGADAQAEGIVIASALTAVNANIVAITDTVVNTNINHTTNQLMNIVANVNTSAMINVNANTGE